MGSLPKYLTSKKEDIHRKPLQVLNSTLDAKWDLTRLSEARFITPVSVYLGMGASRGKKLNKRHECKLLISL